MKSSFAEYRRKSHLSGHYVEISVRLKPDTTGGREVRLKPDTTEAVRLKPDTTGDHRATIEKTGDV